MDKTPISLKEAMKIAEIAARRNLSCFLTSDHQQVLRSDFLEAENCWMFFRSSEIALPSEGELRGGWAYAVSKTGQIREVPDFSDDEKKLSEYLNKMSDYFGRTEG